MAERLARRLITDDGERVTRFAGIELELGVGFASLEQADAGGADVVRTRSAPVVRVAKIVDASRGTSDIGEDDGTIGDIRKADVHLQQMMASAGDATSEADYLSRE